MWRKNFLLSPCFRAVCSCYVPDEDVDGLTVVGAKHHMWGTQEGLQNVDEAWRHLLHLVKNEDGASTLRQVPLHPTLQLPLQDTGGIFWSFCPNLIQWWIYLDLLCTHPVPFDPLEWGEVECGDKLVDERTAHGRPIQMTSQHGADQRLSSPRGAMERQHQGPVGAFILKELCHLLRHNVLSQMLTEDILVEVPLQVCSAGNKEKDACDVQWDWSASKKHLLKLRIKC